MISCSTAYISGKIGETPHYQCNICGWHIEDGERYIDSYNNYKHDSWSYHKCCYLQKNGYLPDDYLENWEVH